VPVLQEFRARHVAADRQELCGHRKVKVVFMDFTFLGNDSVAAALYSRSVWKLYPTQYFAWRIAMYNAQDQEGDQGFGNAATSTSLMRPFPASMRQKSQLT